MALSDIKCRNAKATDKPLKLADGGGLILFVSPAGSKTWRLRYRRDGQEQTLTIGQYPHISLDAARKARDEAKGERSQGVDPIAAKRARIAEAKVAAGTTLEAVARDWHERNRSRWVPRHANDVIESLESRVFPTLGALPVASITVAMILDCLRAIEAIPAIETAGRVRQRLEAVFAYAIASGMVESNPAMTVRGALTPRAPAKKRPALIQIEAARDVLARCDETPAHPTTRLAMRLLALTALRPGTLAGTTWAELNAIDHASPLPVWRVPAQRMKLRASAKVDSDNDFLLPLARQSLEIIAALREFSGDGPLAFPNDRNAHKAMSENALGFFLNRAGFAGRHVPHGWRSVLSSWANEKFPSDSQIIELMLAHQPENKVSAAYNRAQHLQRRLEIAQVYADELTAGLRPVAEIVTLRRKA